MLLYVVLCCSVLFCFELFCSVLFCSFNVDLVCSMLFYFVLSWLAIVLDCSDSLLFVLVVSYRVLACSIQSYVCPMLFYFVRFCVILFCIGVYCPVSPMLFCVVQGCSISLDVILFFVLSCYDVFCFV